MKNIFKFFSIMLAASTMMVFASCGDDPADNPDQPTTYTVSVNTNDATLGTVTVSPLQATYEPGTQVTLTATPAATADFISWSTGSTENPLTLTVNENLNITATFQAKPQPTYNATFDGQALELGWYDAACLDMTAQAGTWMWLFQSAQNEDGGSVYFPFFVTFLLGDATNNFQIYSHELYMETYYQAGGENYGDWQWFNGEGNINCTAVDMTSHTVSATMSATMYSLKEVVEQELASDGSTATHKPFALTFNNIAFDVQAKAGLKKMNVR